MQYYAPSGLAPLPTNQSPIGLIAATPNPAQAPAVAAAPPANQSVTVDVDQGPAKRAKSDTPQPALCPGSVSATPRAKTCNCSHQFLIDENQRLSADYQKLFLSPQFDKTPEERTRLLWDAAKDQHSRVIYLQALMSYCPACWAQFGDSIKAYCKLVQN